MAAHSMSIKKITEKLGVPLRTTKRWLQWLRSKGEMVPHSAGRPRGAGGRFVSRYLLFSVHLGSSDDIRSAFVPASLINAWIAGVPCSTVACVHKSLQASGIERRRSSVQEDVNEEHWPAKQVKCGSAW